MWHDPQRRAAAQEARSRGGQNASRRTTRTVDVGELPKLPETMEEVAVFTRWLLESEATGALDAKTADTMNRTLAILRSAIADSNTRRIGELEAQVAALQRRVTERAKGSGA